MVLCVFHPWHRCHGIQSYCPIFEKSTKAPISNLIGGERGLVSYFEKKKIQTQLIEKEQKLNHEINDLKKKIKLITNNDLDFLDMLYREKLRYGTQDEIIIKIK